MPSGTSWRSSPASISPPPPPAPPAPAAGAAAAVLESPSAHPLEKLAAVLAEHEGWCRDGGRPEAAMEARFVLIEALHGAFSQDDDRSLVRSRLAEFLSRGRTRPLWAVGQAILAEFTRQEDAPDAMVRARGLALEGAERFPEAPVILS